MNSLTSALKQRDDIAAELLPIELRIGKLERLLQSASPATSEKSALHSDHERKLKDWVASGDVDAPPPAMDAARLARMQDEINAFESSKASAQEGLRHLLAARADIVAKLSVAEKAATFEAVTSIAEEQLPIIVREVNAALQAHAIAAGKFESLRGWIFDEARKSADGGMGNGLFSVAERIAGQAKKDMRQTPLTIDHSPFRDALNELLSPANAKEAA